LHVRIPPCSRGGPIEALKPDSSERLAVPTFRRVHAAAPLKQAEAERAQRERETFRRVHAAAPLKPKADTWLKAFSGLIPPCSRGGPIEAGEAWFAPAGTNSHIPPCSRGGPIEAHSPQAPFGPARDIPPCSRGGPIEAHSAQAPFGPVRDIPPCSRGGPIEALPRRRTIALSMCHSAVFTRRPH